MTQKEKLQFWGRHDIVKLWEAYEDEAAASLSSAFDWDATPQRHQFWEDVFFALDENSPLLLPVRPNKLTKRWK